MPTGKLICRDAIKILISDYENNQSLCTAAPSPQKKYILMGGGGCTQGE